MIMMTLNIMGLANIPKKLVVRRLIDEHFLDVIFLQESMCDGSILVGELETMLKYFKDHTFAKFSIYVIYHDSH